MADNAPTITTTTAPVTPPGDPTTQTDPGNEPLREPGLKALESERKRADAAEKAVKDRDAKIAEFENANKSDLEKAQSKATEAEKKAAEAELRALRAEVVLDKKVPANLAKFVTGSTREELESAADELLSAIPAAPTAAPTGPKPDPSQGAKGRSGTSSTDLGVAEANKRFGAKAAT